MGEYYLYTITSATDGLDNKPIAWSSVAATPGSDAAALSCLKQWVLDGYGFSLPTGDSKDSITRDFKVSLDGPVKSPLWGVAWSSDRQDILNITKDSWTVSVTRPPDQDVTVNLTAQVKFGDLTDTVTIPVTVKQASAVPETYNIDYDVSDPLKVDQAKNFAWTDFQRVIQVPDIKTVTLSKPLSLLMLDNEIDPNNSVAASNPVYVLDCQGKTIKPTQDVECLFYSVRGPSVTLKNAVIDMDHKNAKAVFSCQGVLKLENVQVINAENVDYGVSIWANEKWNEHFSASNCQFGQFKYAAVLQSTPSYNYCLRYNRTNDSWDNESDDTNLSWVNSASQFVKLSGCTFNGGGQPGFGGGRLLRFHQCRELYLYRV